MGGLVAPLARRQALAIASAWPWVVPAVVLLLLPLFASTYIMYVLIQILLLTLFALGWNLLFGYTGLLSFGQAGFYAVGAYICAKILLAYPVLLAGVIGGVLASGIAALLLGFFAVRTTRVYFAMVTLAFGMMIHSVVWKWREVTGGDDGLVGIPRAPLGIPGLSGVSIDMTPMSNYYYFVVIASLGALFLFHRLVHSPLGLMLEGIRDSESRIAFAGISVRNYRLAAFVIAGLYAGLAGALLTPLERTVTPGVAHWSQSATPLLAGLLGGTFSFSGPIVGAFLLIIIKDIVVRFTEYWLIWVGAIVVVLVMTFRGGVVSVITDALLPRLKLALAKGRREG